MVLSFVGNNWVQDLGLTNAGFDGKFLLVTSDRGGGRATLGKTVITKKHVR